MNKKPTYGKLEQRVKELEKEVVKGKRVEEALQTSRGHLQLAINAARIAIWDWNVRKNYTVWSDNAEEVLGFRTGTFGNNYEADCYA